MKYLEELKMNQMWRRIRRLQIHRQRITQEEAIYRRLLRDFRKEDRNNVES